MDDKGTNREGGGSEAWARLIYSWRGFVGAVLICACVFSAVGLLTSLSPQAPKGAPLNHVEPVTLKNLAIGAGAGALSGVILGAAGGAGVALLRLAKSYFPTH
jgi:hypothetical protein